MTQPTPTPLPPLSPAERADLDALLSQGWRYDGWTSADDRLSKLEGYTERLVAQLAAAEAVTPDLRGTCCTADDDGELTGHFTVELHVAQALQAQLAAAEAERDALRKAAFLAWVKLGERVSMSNPNQRADWLRQAEAILEAAGVTPTLEFDQMLDAMEAARKGRLKQERDALRARAERAEALVERYAYDCDACGGMGTAAGRMAQGSPPCKVCQPARAYFQEPPARAGEVTG